LENLYEKIGADIEVYGYRLVSAISDVQFPNEPVSSSNSRGFNQKLVIRLHS
jgi:hypothetical protein